MAKSSRAGSVKANNRRLKATVFGPVESARTERLSAKLLELAAQPKPKKEAEESADGMNLVCTMSPDTVPLTYSTAETADANTIGASDAAVDSSMCDPVLFVYSSS
jgi:hypothetical protein